MNNRDKLGGNGETTLRQPKQRLLIFSLVYFPQFVGGAEVALKEMTGHLGSDNFEFHLVTLRVDALLPRNEKIGNITVHRIGFASRKPELNNPRSAMLLFNKLVFPFLACVEGSRLHAAQKFDVVWAIMASYAGFAALFFKWLHRKVYFVLTLQEGDPIAHITRRVGIFRPLFRQIFRRADRVQAISNHLAVFGKEMGHRQEIIVIPNGVDVEKFKNQKSPASPELERGEKIKIEELQKKLGLVSGDKVLITTSRLVEKNAVGDIIRALTFLPENVKLLVAGTGPLEKKLRTLAEGLKIAPRIVFLGFIPHDELPSYLSIANVFVRPSLSEGMGNSFIEAMAAGVPVVGTAVGGITDFLRHKDTGLICKVHDPEDLARQVNILLRDSAIRDTIIENARKMVAEKYDWTLIASRMAKEVLSNP